MKSYISWEVYYIPDYNKDDDTASKETEEFWSNVYKAQASAEKSYKKKLIKELGKLGAYPSEFDVESK